MLVYRSVAQLIVTIQYPKTQCLVYLSTFTIKNKQPNRRYYIYLPYMGGVWDLPGILSHHHHLLLLGLVKALESSRHWGSTVSILKIFRHTVDGRNPAPVDVVNITLYTGFIHPRWCRISAINSITGANGFS